MKKPHPTILILGIGNDILTDDGIGPVIVNKFAGDHFPDSISFQNVSLGGLELLDIMQDFDKVVIIDAIKTGQKPPGTVQLYSPDDFRETLHLSNLHDINFLTALELGKRTGMKVPGCIHIIAVEIVEDRVFSTSFSPEITKKLPLIFKEVEKILLDILSIKGNP